MAACAPRVKHFESRYAALRSRAANRSIPCAVEIGLRATTGRIWPSRQELTPNAKAAESAKAALDVVRTQFEKGAPGVTVTDYLIALQTYIATKVEYYGDLTNYWTAVYQLEQAVGMELRK